jgi:hypothetical protein
MLTLISGIIKLAFHVYLFLLTLVIGDMGMSRLYDLARWLWSGVLAAMLALGLTSPASAEVSQTSTAYVMPGCHGYAANAPWASATPQVIQISGYCVGTVRALVFSLDGVCIPEGTATGPAVQRVTAYLDARRSRWDEDFLLMVTEALRAEFPCK